MERLFAFITFNFQSIFIILINLLIDHPKITFHAIWASDLLINCLSLAIKASNKRSHRIISSPKIYLFTFWTWYHLYSFLTKSTKSFCSKIKLRFWAASITTWTTHIKIYFLAFLALLVIINIKRWLARLNWYDH